MTLCAKSWCFGLAVAFAATWLCLAAHAEAPATQASLGETIMHENGLEGTYLRPEGHGPFPAALIIAGSGPTDRDGNAPVVGLKTNAYRLLAEALAAAGIASLRYDKRGIGASAAAGLHEAELRFDSFIGDAEAMIRWMAGQPGVGPIFLIGHSEGALIALAASNRLKVAGVVSLAGAGRGIGAVLRSQLAGSPFQEEASKLLGELEAGRTVSGVSPALYPLFRPSVQPFMMSWLRLDPAREAKTSKAPLLIVWGRRDLQVSEADFDALARARPDAQTLVIDSMNHVLKDVGESREANQLAYVNPVLPLAHGLAQAIVAFILEHAAGPATKGEAARK
jgi:alpha-beta hydrolase superfamily lysophospholipase